jgi:hypothetical protein
VLVAQPFWKRDPEPEYLAAVAVEASDFSTHEDNVAAGREQGLEPVASWVASAEEWDAYEGLQWRAAKRYAARRPNDPDAAAILDRARVAWEAHERWGRDTIGDGLYLFRRAAE